MQNDNKPLIFNIQKFSTHDGPGIRTTVFFKGCPLKCLWCHNPESQSYSIQNMKTKEGKIQKVGKTYPVDKLFQEVIKDQIFYDQSGGGVTFSGGEVMTQNINYLIDIVSLLKKRGVSIAIDTCGYAPKKNFEKIMPFVDFWLFDIKLLDSNMHKKYTGKSNELILENLEFLNKHNARIIIRLLIIKDLNSDLKTVEKILFWINEKNINVYRIDILPYHDYGKNKYSQLERECTQNFRVPDDTNIKEIERMIKSKGYNVQIGG
ncbi:MAG: glycyl-radical enzyme activating protein [Anaerococcus sp.]